MSDLKIGVDMAIMALVAFWLLLLLANNMKNETVSSLLYLLMFVVMAFMVILSADFVVGIVLFFGIFIVPRIIGGIFRSKWFFLVISK